MARRKKKMTVAKPPPPLQPTDQVIAVYLGLLSLAVFVSFFPLLRYFFAQDDFVLMHIAVRDGWRAVTDFFSQAPGQFRPLSKAVYFGVMYRFFGLNATPYHAVSIILHVVNAILVFMLLRRVGITALASLIATTLFALSVAFFHVIAWVSCVQQLLGQCFMLASLLWGIDYLCSGSVVAKRMSVAAYVLALLCVEQTFGVPLILATYVFLDRGTAISWPQLRRTVDTLSVHLALMVLYLVFIGVWKRVPQEGDYAFSLGLNVWVNLMSYLGWTLQFAAVLPTRMATGSVVWGVSHVALALLFVYHIVKRRGRELLFGLFYFLVAVSPALFLSDHAFYLHTYIAAFGLLYLIALVADDVLATRLFRPGRVRLAVLAIVLVTAAGVSIELVRRNEQYKMFDFLELQRSFVLRRASIARNIFDGILRTRPVGKSVQKVYMVYGREEGRDSARGNYRNVVAATGNGSLINLIYRRPGLPVIFEVVGDAIDKNDLREADVYFFDDFGDCKLMEDLPQD
jgi:hypothetical protein